VISGQLWTNPIIRERLNRPLLALAKGVEAVAELAGDLCLGTELGCEHGIPPKFVLTEVGFDPTGVSVALTGVLGTGPPPALPDFVARRLQHILICGALPQHQLFDDSEPPLALLVSKHVV
jgi:hypothetical protein